MLKRLTFARLSCADVIVLAEITVEVSSSKSVSGGERFFGFFNALFKGGSGKTIFRFSLFSNEFFSLNFSLEGLSGFALESLFVFPGELLF